jgi:cytoskeleton protein RodZ
MVTHELTVNQSNFVSSDLTAVANLDVQDVWRQVKNDLFNSPAYQQVVARLQGLTSTGAATDQLGQLLSKVAQEAIRMTLQCVSPSPVTPEPEALASEEPQAPIEVVTSESPDGIQNWLETMGPVVEQPKADVPQRNNFWKLPKPPNRDTLVAQRRQAWEAQVLEIMRQLRQARETQKLSLEQLNSRTCITVHQLKVLEGGCIEQFPEDVYVRGFVRRIGNALGLDGIGLARTIPSLDISDTHSVLPSWRPAIQEEARGGLRPAHLYMAYATLMAGAAGGLAFTLNPLADTVPQPAADIPMPEPTVQSSQPSHDLSNLDAAKLPSMQAEIAQPETLPFLF